MISNLSTKFKCCFAAIIMMVACSANALAVDAVSSASQTTNEWSELAGARLDSQPATVGQLYDSLAPRYEPQWFAQNNRNFRSRSEVVNEVKRRYNAKVLKISLNQRQGVYKVRILTAGGKVRNVTVSALR